MLTGQCRCLKNVTGEKCENCPYRWVFIQDYGCEPCNNCVHSLLDTTDELALLIDPIIAEYGSADSGYFTTRRMVHINDTIKRLNPRVNELDPDQINLKPLIEELKALEQDSKNMNRRVRNNNLKCKLRFCYFNFASFTGKLFLG